jgi:hypothetical protein
MSDEHTTAKDAPINEVILAKLRGIHEARNNLSEVIVQAEVNKRHALDRLIAINIEQDKVFDVICAERGINKEDESIHVDLSTGDVAVNHKSNGAAIAGTITEVEEPVPSVLS